MSRRTSTMMPGLIELHGHLVILGHGNYPRWFSWIEEHKGTFSLERIMEISAKQLLMAGITSSTDLGASLKDIIAIRDRINRGEVPGPRMSGSGPWLTGNVAIFPANYQINVTSPAQAA